jgi:hypothetical protein
MSHDRKQKLDDLGFTWNVLDESWEESFIKLHQFKELNDHCRVPQKFKLDGFKLGSWVGHQRSGKENLSPERKQRLDDIGFIWDTSVEAWEEGFNKLLQFKELEGHCRVPLKFELDGFKLGSWVGHQRKPKNNMPHERKQRLDKLGFVFDPYAEGWEEGFRKICQFMELEGHCKVPSRFELDGFKLGGWVSGQRKLKDNMPSERKQRLDDIGFIWDHLAEKWEEGFEKLLKFKEVEGHCLVPTHFKLDGFKLGFWISNQRVGQDNMPPERKQRLDDIGFIWDHLAEKWEEGFEKLLKFKEVEGHCDVTRSFKLDGFKLGVWVSNQRSKQNRISIKRKQRLDDIGFIWRDLKDKT